MQRLEVSGAVRPIYGLLGVKRLITRIHVCSRVDATGPRAPENDNDKIVETRTVCN